MSQYVSCWTYPIWNFMHFQDLCENSFLLLKNSTKISLNIFSYLFSFFWDPYCYNIHTFHVAPEISETFLISSFFLFIKFLFLLYFILQYCIGFAIHWHESTMGVHAFPNMNPSSHLPPHNISLGHPRAPAPSMLYPASDIDWRFDSYMIVYMFQCHSPKSSHPLPLPLSPKVCYTHLCLFGCLAYRVITAIFLNSIYMC